jgi:hypothetical protein
VNGPDGFAFIDVFVDKPVVKNEDFFIGPIPGLIFEDMLIVVVAPN